MCRVTLNPKPRRWAHSFASGGHRGAFSHFPLSKLLPLGKTPPRSWARFRRCSTGASSAAPRANARSGHASLAEFASVARGHMGDMSGVGQLAAKH